MMSCVAPTCDTGCWNSYDRLPKIGAKYVQQPQDEVDFGCVCVCARLVAAWTRRQSRGCHIRVSLVWVVKWKCAVADPAF